MKDLKMHATCECRDCDGNGFKYDPLWIDFNSFADAWEKANPRPHHQEPGYDDWFRRQEAADQAWWGAHGYPGGLTHWPAEEYECPTCQGSGIEQVSLTLEDLAKLLELLEREETA